MDEGYDAEVFALKEGGATANQLTFKIKLPHASNVTTNYYCLTSTRSISLKVFSSFLPKPSPTI